MPSLKIGDVVRWNFHPIKGHVQGWNHKHGPGPFIITGISDDTSSNGRDGIEKKLLIQVTRISDGYVLPSYRSCGWYQGFFTKDEFLTVAYHAQKESHATT